MSGDGEMEREIQHSSSPESNEGEQEEDDDAGKGNSCNLLATNTLSLTHSLTFQFPWKGSLWFINLLSRPDLTCWRNLLLFQTLVILSLLLSTHHDYAWNSHSVAWGMRWTLTTSLFSLLLILHLLIPLAIHVSCCVAWESEWGKRDATLGHGER